VRIYSSGQNQKSRVLYHIFIISARLFTKTETAPLSFFLEELRCCLILLFLFLLLLMMMFLFLLLMLLLDFVVVVVVVVFVVVDDFVFVFVVDVA